MEVTLVVYFTVSARMLISLSKNQAQFTNKYEWDNESSIYTFSTFELHIPLHIIMYAWYASQFPFQFLLHFFKTYLFKYKIHPIFNKQQQCDISHSFHLENAIKYAIISQWVFKMIKYKLYVHVE